MYFSMRCAITSYSKRMVMIFTITITNFGEKKWKELDLKEKSQDFTDDLKLKRANEKRNG